MTSITDSRQHLIEAIEADHNCRLIVYFCGDSPIFSTRIAEDALRPLQDHLLGLTNNGRERIKHLALFLCSRGGMMETPWKIVSTVREFCDRFTVIIPEKAYSAATLLALGADKILMGPCGMLGPIDPSLSRVAGMPEKQRDEIGVEDVAAYIRFVKERAGLTDQAVVGQLMAALANDRGPLVLGMVERAYSHIRLVAQKMLALHRPPLSHQQIVDIVEALTERQYAHGHGIGRREAREIGLDVQDLDAEQAEHAWQLFLAYEDAMKLREGPLDPRSAVELAGEDTWEDPDRVGAVLESAAGLHCFTATVRIQPVRQVPPGVTLQPNININVPLPPNLSPSGLPQQIQLAIGQILQNLAQEAREALERELKKLGPVTDYQLQVLPKGWQKKR